MRFVDEVRHRYDHVYRVRSIHVAGSSFESDSDIERGWLLLFANVQDLLWLSTNEEGGEAGR